MGARWGVRLDGLLGPGSSKPLGEEEWVPAVNEEDVVEPPSGATAAVSFSSAASIFISPSAEAGGAVTPGMKNSFSVSRRARCTKTFLAREVENLYLDLAEPPIEVQRTPHGATTQS
eukprot:COSAG04_NODE_7419_length_1131_cov_2.161822_1_plen_117_part_00